MNLPDVSGVTNTAMEIAIRTGNTEAIVIVSLICAIVTLAYFYIKKGR